MCLLGVIHRSVPASLLSPYISKVLDRLEFLIDPSILHRSVALVSTADHFFVGAKEGFKERGTIGLNARRTGRFPKPAL